MDEFVYEKLLTNKKLIQRFVKDYSLPINIFERDMFLYYKDLYSSFNGFFPTDAWNCLIDTVLNKFDGNVDKWLDYCGEVRDKAINEVKSSPEYDNFIKMDMAPYAHVSTVGERSCYTGETHLKRFLSIDLRKANFQALKHVGAIKDATYEEFIKRMGGDDYIVGSKYLRQVIFGNCNPSRQVTVEKHLIDKARNYLQGAGHKWFDEHFKLFSANADEIVYIYDGNEEMGKVLGGCLSLEKEILSNTGVEVKCDFFSVEKLPIVSINGDGVDAYVKDSYFINNGKTLKKASTTFFPQIWKLWKGMEVGINDRKVYFENQLATFDYPLMLKKNDGNV